MPTVKDKLTGDVVSNQPYTAEGTQRAEQIAESDPIWEMDYAPGGKQSAAERKVTTYAGGGKTGYNVPEPTMDDVGVMEYEKGGKTKKALGGKINPKADIARGDGRALNYVRADVPDDV